MDEADCVTLPPTSTTEFVPAIVPVFSKQRPPALVTLAVIVTVSMFRHELASALKKRSHSGAVAPGTSG